MNIGIIGSGNIGARLARHFTALGHAVRIANSRGLKSLSELAHETGAKPVVVAEVPRGAELLVVTIPLENVPDLPKNLLAAFRRTASSCIPATTTQQPIEALRARC